MLVLQLLFYPKCKRFNPLHRLSFAPIGLRLQRLQQSPARHFFNLSFALIMLWYHSSSIEELCCVTLIFLFQFLVLAHFLSQSVPDSRPSNFLFLVVFPDMAEEQNKTPSTPTQTELSTPSIGNYLYLHPSKNLATPLVSPLLEPSNYHSWSRSMLTALSAKNKIELVLGTHPCPAKDHSSYPSCYRCNNMVAS